MDQISAAGRVPVIVAEDDPGNRFVLCRMLDKLGCEVTRALDGAQAVDLARRTGTRVVFMDLNMPGTDGYEAVRRIRGSAELAGLRVVAVTGDVTESTRAACAAAGFDNVLAKPVRIETLEAALPPR